MPSEDQSGLSHSFVKLRQLALSFDRAASLTSDQERELVMLVRELGGTAIPLLLRELKGDRPERSHLAAALLSYLGFSDELRQRVIEAAEASLHSDAGDAAKSRVTSLLDDLLGEPPGPLRLALVREGSLMALGRASLHAAEASSFPEPVVSEMSTLLTTAPAIAQAAHMLRQRLEGHEIAQLIDALGQRAPQRARWLADELLLRNDMNDACRRAIRQVRASLSPVPVDVWQPPPGRQPVSTATVGRHASGRCVIVASRRGEGRGVPKSHRALCLLISADGELIDGLYRDNVQPGAIERDVLAPLRRRGYRFGPESGSDVARLVVQAARCSRKLGQPLPSAFYLGRDLVHIYDQHASEIELDSERDLSALYSRGCALLTAGHAMRARPLLERYVANAPDSADGCASLALCLIALGEWEGAKKHLNRAIWLDPTNPNHHWNLAAIAHENGRVGGCYVALSDYLSLAGEFDAAPGDFRERRTIAERFVAEYERIARMEYPACAVIDVAQADELVHRGQALLAAGDLKTALVVLEQALIMVPTHYPALTCLGVLHRQEMRLDKAEQLLRRALDIRPGYAPAVEALTGAFSEQNPSALADASRSAAQGV